MAIQESSPEVRRLGGLRVLSKLYDMTDGIAEDRFVLSSVLAQELKRDESSISDLAYYLQGNISGVEYRTISITENGVKEIESAKENKETPIEKYPAEMIYQAYNYGNIVQNTSNVSKIVSNAKNVVNDFGAVKKFIVLLKIELSSYDLRLDQKQEVETDLKAVELHASPKPKMHIVNEIGRHILDVIKPVAFAGLT